VQKRCNSFHRILLYIHTKTDSSCHVPSTLLGTGDNWTLLKAISVTEYLNYESGVTSCSVLPGYFHLKTICWISCFILYNTGKFSKNKGIGVFGNDVKDTNIPPEVWRYYLLTNRPEVRSKIHSTNRSWCKSLWVNKRYFFALTFRHQIRNSLGHWADLQAKLNNELVNILGNFINRVLSFIAKPEGH